MDYWGFTVIGWASLVTSIFFIGGVTLTVLGVQGIYIGRIFQQVKNRPLFIISESKLEAAYVKLNEYLDQVKETKGQIGFEAHEEAVTRLVYREINHST